MALSRRELAWASGSLATGSVYNAVALFALFFMTQVLGIQPGLAGTLLLVTKLYDGFTDPLMGAISDRTQHRLGPRRPYLLAGAVLLAAGFVLFFNAPELGPAATIAVAVLLLLLQSTGYTVFAVPYLAMAPDVAPAYDARTRLMTLRVAFLVLGVMFGSVLGPVIVGLGETPREGYSLLGLVIGAVVLAFGLTAFFGTAGTESGIRAGGAKDWRSAFPDLVDVFRRAPFRLLTLVKLLQLMVLALALACTPYFFQYVLEKPPSEIGRYLLVFSGAGLLSLPAWRWLIGVYGKREVYILSITGYAVALLSWWLWQPGEPAFGFYLRALVIGVLSNGTLLCALALLPDTMEFDRLTSGHNREGIMSGVFTTVEKLSGALGPFIIGWLLQAMGLVTGRVADIEQPASALRAIHLGVSVVPALVCIAAVPLLLRYRLGARELAGLRAEASN